MKHILQKIKHEFLQVLPPTLFFLVAFNIVAITTALILRWRGLEVKSILIATVLALIAGKVIPVADHLPFINKFPGRPLIYNITWKTFIYVLAVALARYLERLIPLLLKGGGVAAAHQHIMGEFVWPRFVAVQIWFVVIFLFYSVLVELVRALGKERVLKMFLGRG